MCFDDYWMDRTLHFRARIISFHFFSFIICAWYFTSSIITWGALLFMILINFVSNSKTLNFLFNHRSYILLKKFMMHNTLKYALVKLLQIFCIILHSYVVILRVRERNLFTFLEKETLPFFIFLEKETLPFLYSAYSSFPVRIQCKILFKNATNHRCTRHDPNTSIHRPFDHFPSEYNAQWISPSSI